MDAEATPRWVERAESPRSARIVSALAVVISAGLGGMLLFAAVQKGADPGAFIEQIRGYRVFPALAPLAAYGFIAVEVVLGLLMISYVIPRIALVAFVALMAFFIAITGWAWAHGHTGGCGCFGRLANRPPWAVMLEDGVFVLLAAFALWGIRETRGGIQRSRGRWLAFAAGLPVVLGGVLALPRLPVDPYVTGLRVGVSLENLAADDLKAPLNEGKVLLVLLGDGCTACTESLPALEKLATTEGAPRVSGVFAGDRKQTKAWALEHVPSFALAHAPEKVLHQYYRRLPVFVLLESGRVQKVWWNRVPTPEQVLSVAG